MHFVTVMVLFLFQLFEERGGPVGQCCGDECKANGTCKSAMYKCRLQEEIRRNVTAGQLDFVKRMSRRNISVKTPSPQ
uniref:Putative secreted protein n=1 Tax=Amblyomma triste TaxID=251400 RepID=A0A023G104_AMBTT